MKLPELLCKRFHCPTHWTGRTSHNVKTAHVIYKLACWCSKCHVFRYIRYPWCEQCYAYMLPKHGHREREVL